MCGIAGYIPNNFLPCEKVLGSMGRVMYSRGPDDEGVYINEDLGLVHRRLSIVDLEHGKNPLFNEDGTVCAMLNGEIYNHRELRHQLQSKGHVFRTVCDTEVLVHLYEEHGRDLVDHLNGMFVFVIYDCKRKALLIFRDRMGQKPLYFTSTNNVFAFASDIRCFDCIPQIRLSVDTQAEKYMLRYQYVPAPLSIYNEVEKLMPGSGLEYRDGSLQRWCYWAMPRPVGPSLQSSYANLCEEFNELLNDSVRLRMMADVPLGSFLSGGLDSTAITSVMADIVKRTRTYSIGFSAASYDEAGFARDIAAELETEHTEYNIDQIPHDEIDLILKEFGEPFADASAIPTYYLCKMASTQVKVALSGDGADELMGGYNRYRVGSMAKLWTAIPDIARPASLSAMVDWIPEGDEYYASSHAKKVKHGARLIDVLCGGTGRASSRVFTDKELSRISSYKVEFDIQDPVLQRDRLYSSIDLPERMLYADCVSYLPDDIFVKVDRMSMAHSLEVRSPFMDHRLVEFLARAPMSCKLNKGVSKKMLRDFVEPRFPTITKRPKHGFEAPIAKWLSGPLFESYMDLLSDGNDSLIDGEYVQKLCIEHRDSSKDHSKKLWPIYVLLKWKASN